MNKKRKICINNKWEDRKPKITQNITINKETDCMKDRKKARNRQNWNHS